MPRRAAVSTTERTLAKMSAPHVERNPASDLAVGGESQLRFAGVVVGAYLSPIWWFITIVIRHIPPIRIQETVL